MTLAICAPQLGAYSETFIKNHILKIFPNNTIVLTNKIIDLTGFENIPILEINESSFLSIYSKPQEDKIIDFFKKYHASHILIEFANSFSQLVELNFRKLKLPINIHFHGWDASKALKNKTIVRYYQWLSLYVNKIIVVSEAMKKELIKNGINGDKIIVNYYGVDLEKLRNIDSEKKTNEKCRFIFVGRFVPKKAPLKLLKAFFMAYKKNKNIELVMIGNTPEYYKGDNLFEKCKKFVEENHLNRAVKFLGVLPHNEALKEISRSDVYIQHSITCPETGDKEGLPNSILEASLLGLPVISTKHAGIPEAVIHGENGYLVGENDIESMAEYIVILANDIEKRKQMGKKSIELNSHKFSLVNSLNKLRKIITQDAEILISNFKIEKALKEYYSFSPKESKIKEIKDILSGNIFDEVVIYGYGYGIKQNNDILVKSNVFKYLTGIVDDNIKENQEYENIELYTLADFYEKNSKKKILFIISALTKETYLKMISNIKKYNFKNYKIIRLAPELI